MLELWELRNTPLFPLLRGPLWVGVVASIRDLSMGQIELNCVSESVEMGLFDIETTNLLKTAKIEPYIYIYIYIYC